jgi:hypothetical protein
MKKNYTKRLMLYFIASVFCFSIHAQIIADGTYNIFNPTLNEVIGVNTIAPGDSGNPQNVIIGRARMRTYNINDDLQKWTFTHQGSDVYKITNVGDNSTLGIKDGWCGQFGDVQVGFDNTSPYVLIKVVNASIANTFAFQIAFDASCNFGSSNIPIKGFDIDGGTSGSKIHTFDSDVTNANQQFQILALGTLSINNNFLSNNLTVFYNPNDGLVIKSKQNIGWLNVKILDISGREIESVTIQNQEDTVKLIGVSKGIYLADISDDSNNKFVKKFIVN